VWLGLGVKVSASFSYALSFDDHDTEVGGDYSVVNKQALIFRV